MAYTTQTQKIIDLEVRLAKKEVFDDIDKITLEGVSLFHDDCNCEWCELKKKHLG